MSEEKARARIVSLLGALFPPRRFQITAFWYGSRLGRDADLAIVLDDTPEQSAAIIGDIDFTFFDQESFSRMLSHGDPLITEPVLDGEILREDIKLNIQTKLSTETPKYLMERYFDVARNLHTLLDAQNISKYDNISGWFFVTLSYCLSYKLFSSYYKSFGVAPILFVELRSRISLESRLLLDKILEKKIGGTLRQASELLEKVKDI